MNVSNFLFESSLCDIGALNLLSTDHFGDTTLSYLKSLATRLFTQQLMQTDIKESIETLHYWPFFREIHQSLVASLKKGPVMQSFDKENTKTLHYWPIVKRRHQWLVDFPSHIPSLVEKVSMSRLSFSARRWSYDQMTCIFLHQLKIGQSGQISFAVYDFNYN